MIGSRLSRSCESAYRPIEGAMTAPLDIRRGCQIEFSWVKFYTSVHPRLTLKTIQAMVIRCVYHVTCSVVPHIQEIRKEVRSTRSSHIYEVSVRFHRNKAWCVRALLVGRQTDEGMSHGACVIPNIEYRCVAFTAA